MNNFQILIILKRLNEMEAREQKEIERNKDYKRMGVKIVYWITKNKMSLSKAIEAYQKTFKELTDRYKVKTVEDKLKTEDETKQAEFDKELNELLSIEVEVNIVKINIEDFGDCVISQADMDAMNFMIE